MSSTKVGQANINITEEGWFNLVLGQMREYIRNGAGPALTAETLPPTDGNGEWYISRYWAALDLAHACVRLYKDAQNVPHRIQEMVYHAHRIIEAGEQVRESKQADGFDGMAVALAAAPEVLKSAMLLVRCADSLEDAAEIPMDRQHKSDAPPSLPPLSDLLGDLDLDDPTDLLREAIDLAKSLRDRPKPAVSPITIHSLTVNIAVDPADGGGTDAPDDDAAYVFCRPMMIMETFGGSQDQMRKVMTMQQLVDLLVNLGVVEPVKL